MVAYWVSRVHVTDAEEYSKYAVLAGPILEKFGGNFLARGGRQVILDGDDFERTVVAVFPSVEAAVECWNSAEYVEARKFTLSSSIRHIVAIEGLE
jgi:uncharacterized protein (DUF1330 family)